MFYGTFVLIQILIWTMVFFLSNFLIGLNPFNKEFHTIRIMSIIVIIFILYYNSIQSTIATLFILPLSISKITYLDDIMEEDQSNLCYIKNKYINRF